MDQQRFVATLDRTRRYENELHHELLDFSSVTGVSSAHSLCQNERPLGRSYLRPAAQVGHNKKFEE